MKVTQSAAASPAVLAESAQLGNALARLRVARHIQQRDAAMRAGLSRNTAYRLEKGDPGVALGQWLRYLEAIAPGLSLLDLISNADPSLDAQTARERTQRVRDLTANELNDLDF
ncbi:helix-turn-helix transcriptional regulator [Paraburkholderia sp.]|uniref:helix-turn-helix domain-containing protein n=1 Tax=Paraburkholderia sp. TaxID=1926495 RepID=UPI00239F7405|nr:helix-turn-helix transcriptional regulator [Paraburkholderia sp.]MDE1182576.1 helix-turn-helix transcriptional regulator [Paraburkholderia sp.]